MSNLSSAPVFRIEQTVCPPPAPSTFVLLLRGTKGGEDVLAVV